MLRAEEFTLPWRTTREGEKVDYSETFAPWDRRAHWRTQGLSFRELGGEGWPGWEESRALAISLTACVFSLSSVEILARIEFAVKPIAVNIKKKPVLNADAKVRAHTDSQRSRNGVYKHLVLKTALAPPARRLVGENLPVADVNHAMRELGDVRLVGDQHDRVAFTVQVIEERHYFEAGF
jgi:hypothetical protein